MTVATAADLELETSASLDEPSRGLLSWSFLGLLVTQLLTAINDNIFRWLAIGIGKDFVSRPQQGKILMAGTACFVLPYLFLAAPAGYLADRFSKRDVIVVCKVAEIVLMLLGFAAIWWGSLWGLFVVVGLTGAQSALFSPSKMGSIPELLAPSKISAANGLFGLATVAATVIGMVVGSQLSDVAGLRGQENPWPAAFVLVGMAIVGTIASLLIYRVPASTPERRFPWNAVTQTIRDLGALASQRALLRVAFGMVFFWSVGALAQMNIDQFAFEGGATREVTKTPLLVALVFGVGLGSVLAGIWSRGHVELGILPLGALGVAISSLLLFTVQGEIFHPAGTSEINASLIWACILLFTLGVSAGLFSVPLEAYLQHRSPAANRGAILAAANFLIFAGILGSSLLFYGLRYPLRPGAEQLPPTLAEVSPEFRAEVQQRAMNFEAAWKADSPRPEIDDYLEELPEAARPAALAQLVWIDVRARREVGESLPDFDYLEAYPEHASLLREVLIAANARPLFSARQIFLLCGIFTIPVFVYTVCLLPQASVRFLVWLASSTVYRIHLHGREHVPADRGALLVANHVSWVDGLLLLVTSSRPIRFIVWSGNFERPLMRGLARLSGAIPLTTRPKAIVHALQEARTALDNGELVCIFPEGGISRSGQLQGFKRGALKIIGDSDIPVVPVYLHGLWGSIFSFERGRFFWKLPRRIPYPISIHYGQPLVRPRDQHEIRRAVQDLGADAVQQHTEQIVPVPRTFIRQCKRRMRRSKVADSTGTDLTGGALLMRTLILRRLLNRVLSPEEQYVGVLLPPSVPGVITNAALALDKRIACNLNYTVTSDVINQCIELAGIRHVITSRRFMEKMNFKLSAELIYLEDSRTSVTTTDKLVCAAATYAVPARVLERRLGLDRIKKDDVLTVIFTSGSTGTPKGVMLTQGNVASNAEAVNQVVHLRDDDVLVGILPFFHSFGYTISMWTVLHVNIKGVYHYSPLDAKQIGKLCKEHHGTLLLATPTFLRNYARRCDPDDFATLDVVVAGAEKLPRDLSDAFEKRFGVRPVEGYGTTELSPLVSVNIPQSRTTETFQPVAREGSVGRPIPGVGAKITHLENGAELGANQEGMLWIQGPNVMAGYLKRPDLTADVLREGWYKTGDIARIDEDGFIHITGRESRFSKIGGEMVPHVQVEEAINRLLEASDELKAAVTAVPDDKKGERLIVLHTDELAPNEIRQSLLAAGLPPLFVPGTDAFLRVEKLPILGSGKLDLKSMKQIALDLVAREDSAARGE